MTNHLIFYFRKGFYLIDEINDKIRAFKSGGITNYFIAKYADEKFSKINNLNEGPSALQVYHFIGIIQLWAFGLGMSLVIFIGENVINKMKRQKWRI